MPENEETEQVETEPQEPNTAPEAEQAKADPWADPETARKEIEKLRKESMRLPDEGQGPGAPRSQGAGA